LLIVASAGAPAHGPLEEQIAKATAEIARDPTNAQLYVRRGELRRVHEEWDAALADYRRASVLAPADDRIDFLRGRALQEAGRPAQAKAALDVYLAQHPGHVAALVARARALRALGEYLAAVEDFSRAIERSPRPDPDMYLERARVQVAAGETVQAIAGIDAAIARLGPIPALQLLAVDLDVQQGGVDDALARLDALAARSPRKETWLARRGEILAQAGRPDAARTAYVAALSAIEALPPDTRRTKAIADLEGQVRSALAAK
jgi:tetratricopeptide (TPR) repeat protein